MNSCKFGFHKWAYAIGGNGRWCNKCQKKEEKNAAGKWVESQKIKPAKEKPKFCECPRDYTISIKSMACPHCGLPRRPR